MSNRLIVVSNRLPLTLRKADGHWTTERSSGGLASAMNPILRRNGGDWIGWAGASGEEDQEERRSVLEDWAQKEQCFAVELPEEIATGFYEGYSNQTLWPVFHNLPSQLKFDAKDWQAYVEANRIFSKAIVERYKPDDLVWVHDYQLMLLPQMLRDELPDAAIGFFLHIPFPSSEIFPILPRREELLQGLLGADLVAFQTHGHLQQFRSALLRVLGIESKVTEVTDHPHQAAPPPSVLSLLTALARESKNCVALMSGRPAEDLDRWFGAIGSMWLVAEHGADLKPPGSSWEPLRSPVPTDWKSTVMPILEHFVDRTPGSFVEEKKYTLVWHHRLAEPEFGAWLANELVSMLEAMLADTELRAFRGQKMVEVRPVWANKGEAFERILAGYSQPDFLFAAGDDRTDEDLFERLRDGAWTVHVGPGATRAAFMVRDFESLRSLLETFTQARHLKRA